MLKIKNPFQITAGEFNLVMTKCSFALHAVSLGEGCGAGGDWEGE